MFEVWGSNLVEIEFIIFFLLFDKISCLLGQIVAFSAQEIV